MSDKRMEIRAQNGKERRMDGGRVYQTTFKKQKRKKNEANHTETTEFWSLYNDDGVDGKRMLHVLNVM